VFGSSNVLHIWFKVLHEIITQPSWEFMDCVASGRYNNLVLLSNSFPIYRMNGLEIVFRQKLAVINKAYFHHAPPQLIV